MNIKFIDEEEKIRQQTRGIAKILEPSTWAVYGTGYAADIIMDELTKLNQICGRFVVGSDQLWNPNMPEYSGPEFFLSFAEQDKIKVAYATVIYFSLFCLYHSVCCLES